VQAFTQGFAGAGSIRVFVSPCAASAPQQLAVTQVNNEISVVVAVHNDGNATLPNVTLSFEGLPATWKVSSQGVDIPAQSERNVTAKIIADTQESVEPTVVVRSNGREVARKKLEAVNKPSGITGFFTGAVNNSLLLIFLAIAAVVVIFTFARSKKESDDEAKREEEYREKMKKIREQLAGKDDKPKPPQGDSGTIK